MKIQCDVCSKDEASVYCTADEAALCDTCDHRVHHANKLASKHHRFSLIHPSAKSFPLCDICQEKRAFLFCQQDRAILCRDCDAPIHKANEHTQKHNRFLLTGAKLSATAAAYMPITSSSSNHVLDSKSQQPPSTAKTPSSNSAVIKNLPPINTAANKGQDNLVISEGFGNSSVSSISEYLMETLPGWHVEDFLDFPSTPCAFNKFDNNEILQFGGDDSGASMSPFGSENMGIWVPRGHPIQEMGGQIGMKATKETASDKANNRSRWSDDAFTVPQISPQCKRSRSFW
ncbi:B-box zinc finger protein 21-like [Mercurialis annua]|uniref:B-box zinc finger protein 21-like n=1 Tax=Mercurialis annua TaxID=3986 RepID=UPI00215EA8C1|nr:B-box zinc finger protein 21-like [Mercurialis annua]